jgi:hypothetical protein|tara:strand:+ start:94 stop:654 length:561 start_codon:yes stop_codon:yes gene_type:complete
MKKRTQMPIFSFLVILLLILNSCGPFKYKRTKAGEVPVTGSERVKKNMEEGKGFRLIDLGKKKGGTFDFASSNELWRASLDTIDFMPLASANYSGGIIITDWYNDGSSNNQSVKISIRFLTNEVRSDALDIKIFTKNCNTNIDCKVYENKGNLIHELKKSILKKAALYEKQNKDKKKKPYTMSKPG